MKTEVGIWSFSVSPLQLMYYAALSLVSPLPRGLHYYSTLTSIITVHVVLLRLWNQRDFERPSLSSGK